MVLRVFDDAISLGRAAAAQAAAAIRGAIQARGRARVVAATGASQFQFLEELTAEPGMDWGRVELFHLDEYIGLPMAHPASFRRFLHECLIDKTGITEFHLLNGEADAEQVIRQTSQAIAAAPIDIAFAGIGENGHLAFNDPPADFETEEPYIVVNLDEACRRQQFGEGWFPTLEAVPRQAISMSIRQLMKSEAIICSAPDARKAKAVQGAVNGPVTPQVPASILQQHPN